MMIRFAAIGLGLVALATLAAPVAAQKGDRTRLLPEEIAT